ncbi:MAG TPA: GatB/YqeY domain-containing protein [Candidatus Saccharimonadales bacterium]|nr:GatB/YqeY domain-containing protein [Candidatus Saccharimonadales bacterium]
MNKLVDQINRDLKNAMLSGDSQLVSVLKGMKNAIQYAEVDTGSKLSEEQIIKVLQKEAKKRVDAQKIYADAGDAKRAENEDYEKKIISNYLPEPLSREKVAELVDNAISEQVDVKLQDIGRIIAAVRQKSEGRADGSLIAQLVKEKLNK